MSRRRRPDRTGLDLVAPDGDLPLGFRVGAHLTGELTPFERDGEPMAGAALGRALADVAPLGTVVELTVSGKYRPQDADIEELFRWQTAGSVFGPLDPVQLGRLTHSLTRDWLKRTFPPGQTPPEVYVTRVQVRTEPRAAVVVPAPGGGRPIRSGIVDTETGKAASRTAWRRSRAAIRAWQKRKGETGYRRGRYVLRRRKPKPKGGA